MSKHILNSIILLMIFIILLGGGFYFIQQKYNTDILKLKKNHSIKTSRYKKLITEKNQLPEKITRLTEMKYTLENYPIMLLKTQNMQRMYSYFEKFDKQGNFFDFKYKMNNQKNKSDVIEGEYNLTGKGNFIKLQQFINYLEYSPPLFFVKNLNYRQNKKENTGTINLTFSGIFSKNSPKGIEKDIFTVKTYKDYIKMKNPFLPLILWNLPINTNNLIDIRNNKLLALTKNTAYFKSVTGEIISIGIGTKVYLGKLNSIDEKKGHAIFIMNYGGIYKKLIRKLNENNKNEKYN